MARLEIIEKLDSFLSKHNPLTEECQVVYLIVEIRKILDHENCHEFPLLRFYCNWTVHTEKSRITKEIRERINKIYQAAKAYIENPEMVQVMPQVMQFAYMKDLHKEMKRFLEERNINTALVGESNWLQFVQLLVKVLENQPINNPTDDVVSFSFIPAAEHRVQGIIKFKQPIEGKNYYRFVSIY